MSSHSNSGHGAVGGGGAVAAPPPPAPQQGQGGGAPPPWANPNVNSQAPPQEEMGMTHGGGGGGGGGNDNMGGLLQPVSTLDEPVMETIMRDVRAVGQKLKVVMLPLDRSTPFGYAGVGQEEVAPAHNQQVVINTLRDWDLWGPLVICLCLSVILSIRAPPKQASIVFASVFVAIWAGSAVVTINAQLLGGTISFFQSVCVLGYCVYPMCVAALVIEILGYTWFGVVWLDLIWISIGFVWATRASSVFIGQYIGPEKRALAVFPVFFFYVFLGWMILLF